MARHSSGFHPIAWLAVVLLASCGGSSQKQVEQAAETLRSWQATLELVSTAREDGSVPEQFAEQVRAAAAQGRASAEAKLRKAAP
ncbi:MAG TPA: hypothetical protein VJQ46_07500 [Gemmatimonadales bacterium]|nr:hypothetical protein [Gemmatimonadales bacterium]